MKHNCGPDQGKPSVREVNRNGSFCYCLYLETALGVESDSLVYKYTSIPKFITVSVHFFLKTRNLTVEALFIYNRT